MTFTTMKGLCRALAKYDRQDELAGASTPRHVFREEDFTEADRKVVRERAGALEGLLGACGGRRWSEVLPEIRKIIASVRLGFKMQDEIIATCRRNGIRIE